jgi:hypothetical protein
MQNVTRQLPYWPDTAAMARNEALETVPPPVMDVARQCIARFHQDSVPLGESFLWMRLYLIANRDDLAEAVLNRRLENTQWDTLNPEGRQAVLSKAMEVYTGAQPVRWKQLHAIGAQLEAQKAVIGPLKMLSVYGMLLTAAKRLDDTASTQRNAERILAVAQSLTAAEKASSVYRIIGTSIVTPALDWLFAPALRDSLRRSAAAYAALKRSHWITGGGDTVRSDMRFVGKPATSLVARFWLSSKDTPAAGSHVASNGPNATAQVQHPTPGKAALVVFLSSACRDEIRGTSRVDGESMLSGPCWQTYAAIRRFGERFPHVDITIAATARGYIGEAGPLTPQQEAQVLRAWWIGYHRLPVTIAVSTSESYRLAEPDRRVMEDANANELGYGFGTSVVGETQAFVIAPTGEILLGGELNRMREAEYREILEGLEEGRRQVNADR